jgi:mannose-6-phosphate isomerase class I
MLRRCYYVDFEAAGELRKELLATSAIDYYVSSDDPALLKLLPRAALDEVLSALARTPFRCKPVYLEGVWGGTYVKRLRNLPAGMRNCAWVFDLIPLEVSILVEVGSHLLDLPFFTFVQKEGEAIMGAKAVARFGGYFPIRFNYDDTFHSGGNMSIQVHPGEEYAKENFGEHGRQDESYYVVATGHGAKTYLGFHEDANPEEFLRAARKSETEGTPVDHDRFIHAFPSRPGTQFLIPAGTVHASGRNQVILEIGSLTVGSYTYKLYDYLRRDLDGTLRPIHTYHGERVLAKERRARWVGENLVQEPRLVRKGDGWAEYVVGEHPLVYFSLRRIELESVFEDDTAGTFHVLNLVDGEQVLVESLTDPALCYRQGYLDIVVVPASVGRYRIRNLGSQPVVVHKTLLRDPVDAP